MVKKRVNTATKIGANALITASKRVVQKITEATGKMIQ